MSPDTIKKMIETTIPDSRVETSGEDCSSSIVVISSSFAGLSPIKCHRIVNDIFKEQFASGELHALSIKTKVS